MAIGISMGCIGLFGLFLCYMGSTGKSWAECFGCSSRVDEAEQKKPGEAGGITTVTTVLVTDSKPSAEGAK